MVRPNPLLEVYVAEKTAANLVAARPCCTDRSHRPATRLRIQLLRAMGRCGEAIREYQMALASNRNWASAIGHIGRCKIYIGPIEEAIPLEEQAIRLSPRNSDIGLWYFRIGQVHLPQSRIGEATAWLEKARSAGPTLALASAYALKGETERAVILTRSKPGSWSSQALEAELYSL